MEDLFEMMMDSQQLKSRRRKVRRQSEGADQLEGQLLREALGGSFLTAHSPTQDASWMDIDHALASESRGSRSPSDALEDGWSGESYDTDLDIDPSRPFEGEED
ncbi:MAG: hypothetical protein JST16_05760 [Bdellovibrionales bacterium]|nr:hypothetical protein [Bdellovibrionales bacterium]